MGRKIRVVAIFVLSCQFQKYLRMLSDRAEINANVAMLFANSFESDPIFLYSRGLRPENRLQNYIVAKRSVLQIEIRKPGWKLSIAA